MSHSLSRKRATRVSDIDPEILTALSHGEQQSATLVEVLAIDQTLLLRSVFPALSTQSLQTAEVACQQGIVKRMAGISAILLAELGMAGIELCMSHRSDTVRGWACFMIGAQTEMRLTERLDAIRPLADDGHFGVREWAWLAVRPALVLELENAIEQLAVWTGSPSERIRRFASEALRPRGVWSAHIAALKQQPERALPILSPLRADPSPYVQDSLANWLNDAAKSHPDWVMALCQQWLQPSPSAATQRICKRAMRNLK